MAEKLFGMQRTQFVGWWLTSSVVLVWLVESCRLDGWLNLAWLLSVPVLAALAVIDAHTLRLPNAMTLGLPIPVLSFLGLDAAATRSHASLFTAMITSLALFTLYLGLNRVSRGGIGMGDAKLALTIGLLTGYMNPMLTMMATALAFLSVSVVGLLLLALRRVKLSSSLPLGPYMVVGAFVALLLVYSPLGVAVVW